MGFFSAAFAQTLAFGLLLVREGTGEPGRTGCLAAHAGGASVDADGASGAEVSMRLSRMSALASRSCKDTVNSFAPEILVARPDGRDPILYFYEDFLRTFDPERVNATASTTRRSRWCSTWSAHSTVLCARIWSPKGFVIRTSGSSIGGRNRHLPLGNRGARQGAGGSRSRRRDGGADATKPRWPHGGL